MTTLVKIKVVKSHMTLTIVKKIKVLN